MFPARSLTVRTASAPVSALQDDKLKVKLYLFVFPELSGLTVSSFSLSSFNVFAVIVSATDVTPVSSEATPVSVKLPCAGFI